MPESLPVSQTLAESSANLPESPLPLPDSPTHDDIDLLANPFTHERPTTPFPSHKRNLSSAFSLSNTPSGSTSAASDQPAKKRARHANGSSALNNLSEQFADFADTFRTHTQRKTSSSAADRNLAMLQPAQQSSPVRKSLAMQHAQNDERDLPIDDLIALIDLFQSDVTAADAYLVLEMPGLRRQWVENKLTGLR